MYDVDESVGALSKMAAALDTQLSSLLLFFGETPESPEAPKPEDLFGLVITFSTSLQVCIIAVFSLHFLDLGSLFVESSP